MDAEANTLTIVTILYLSIDWMMTFGHLRAPTAICAPRLALSLSSSRKEYPSMEI